MKNEATSILATKAVKDSKICPVCKKEKPISEFYTNKDWKEESYTDRWCKECVNKCDNKDEIKKYFWENNREWNEKVWMAARNRADKVASLNEIFRNAPDDKKTRILERLTCQNVPSAMVPYYKFLDKKVNGTENLSYEDAKQEGLITDVVGDPKDRYVPKDDDVKIYSPEFNGYFKQSEIDRMKEYYDRLVGPDSPYNLQDYARKLVKASFQADKAQSDFAASKCDFTTVKDAITLFDMLSKSALFAECKRKPEDTASELSVAEITDYCERNGHPCTRKIEWPQDDVDKTIAEFRYSFEALGLDS